MDSRIYLSTVQARRCDCSYSVRIRKKDKQWSQGPPFFGISPTLPHIRRLNDLPTSPTISTPHRVRVPEEFLCCTLRYRFRNTAVTKSHQTISPLHRSTPFLSFQVSQHATILPTNPTVLPPSSCPNNTTSPPPLPTSTLTSRPSSASSTKSPTTPRPTKSTPNASLTRPP